MFGDCSNSDPEIAGVVTGGVSNVAKLMVSKSRVNAKGTKGEGCARTFRQNPVTYSTFLLQEKCCANTKSKRNAGWFDYRRRIPMASVGARRGGSPYGPRDSREYISSI